MAEPRVSVICIFLNEERFLAEAVDSVLAQDFDDFELLLVDDGSTDASGEIARSYAAAHPKRIFYLEHPGHANRGMSATRNLGLRHARGEYVTMMDGDDRWYPNKLREQVGVLDANLAVGMVCGGYRTLRANADGADDWFLSGPAVDGPCHPPETTLKVYPLGWTASPKDPLIRREIALRVGGYEDAFRGLYEDQAFLAKIYLDTAVAFVPSVWLEYRRHENSFTAKLSVEQYAAVRKRYLDWFESYLAGTKVEGEMRIRQALRRARNRMRNVTVFRLHLRLRRAWVRALRLAGFGDLYRRDCTSD